MSTEYHQILIKKLYSNLSPKELVELLGEIGETQAPAFITHLQEIYKIYKTSSFSHIIISTISKIDSPRKVDIAKEILTAKDTPNTDLGYALKILKDMEYYDNASLDILKKKIPKIIKNESSYQRDFLITDILSYFSKAKKSETIDKELQKIYKDSSFDLEVRELSLKNWLLNNPSERISTLKNNYSKIKKDERLEKTLAKISTELDREYAQNIMMIIRTYGSSLAKSTLQYYQNLLPTREISALKNKINLDSNTGVLGQDIFGRDKDFDKQLKPASSKDELVSICNSLRVSLQDFNPLLKFHGLSEDEIKKILPNSKTEDYKKSINSAELYLYSKGIVLSEEFKPLRRFNRLISIILHPEKDKEMMSLLVEFNLLNEYNNQNWEDIHYKMLEIYLSILKPISKKIEHP